jgi:transcriptional regulator with XRE-family HTH domain
MLSLYEGEKQRPQLDTLEKLLDALGVRLAELAARLEGRPTEQTTDSKRRGPRRSTPGAPEASGLEAEASGLEAEAAAAATQVLRGIGVLLRIAARGANRVAAAPPEVPTRGPIG